MATTLTWKDLTQTQLLYILQSKSPSEVRGKLQQAMWLTEIEDESKSEILLDLYFSTLLFAQEKGFSFEKMSTLISIVKANHEEATEKPCNMERSWEHLKKLLLMHTVQRPPFSMACFSLGDLQLITRYLLHTYYKHYKLYQYAFNPTYILDVETIKDLNLVELTPTRLSLSEAHNQKERDSDLLELQRRLEEIDRKVRETDQLALEAAVAASIEASYRATIPEQVTQAAAEAVSKYALVMRDDIEEKLKNTDERLMGKLLEVGISDVKASEGKQEKKQGIKAGGKEGKH